MPLGTNLVISESLAQPIYETRKKYLIGITEDMSMYGYCHEAGQKQEDEAA